MKKDTWNIVNEAFAPNDSGRIFPRPSREKDFEYWRVGKEVVDSIIALRKAEESGDAQAIKAANERSLAASEAWAKDLQDRGVFGPSQASRGVSVDPDDPARWGG